MRFAVDTGAGAAWAVLNGIHAMAAHEFWDDGFSYREVETDAIIGPAQVTDAWLAALARRRKGRWRRWTARWWRCIPTPLCLCPSCSGGNDGGD